MSSDLRIAGFVAPGFEAVSDAFATEPRGGSALTILRGGVPVVDLREGWRDVARTQPWGENALVNVYSVGKPVIALGLVLLVERGLLSLDDRVPRLWPQFTTDASVREVLAHTAGLPFFPVVRDASAWSDWDLLCGDLAAATPEWPAGTVAAEHALTYGHLVGELIRRVDGRPPVGRLGAGRATGGGRHLGHGRPGRAVRAGSIPAVTWRSATSPGAWATSPPSTGSKQP